LTKDEKWVLARLFRGIKKQSWNGALGRLQEQYGTRRVMQIVDIMNRLLLDGEIVISPQTRPVIVDILAHVYLAGLSRTDRTVPGQVSFEDLHSLLAVNLSKPQALAAIREIEQLLQQPEDKTQEDSGDTSALILADNVKTLFGPTFYEVLGRESIGGNAGRNHAGVSGVIDGAGRIIAFGNLQDLSLDIRARLERNEVYLFLLRVGVQFKRGKEHISMLPISFEAVRDDLLPAVPQRILRHTVDEANRRIIPNNGRPLPPQISMERKDGKGGGPGNGAVAMARAITGLDLALLLTNITPVHDTSGNLNEVGQLLADIREALEQA
jgi:hypothetical protein